VFIKRPHPLCSLEKNRDDGEYFGSFPEIVRLSSTMLENVIGIFLRVSITTQRSYFDKIEAGTRVKLNNNYFYAIYILYSMLNVIVMSSMLNIIFIFTCIWFKISIKFEIEGHLCIFLGINGRIQLL
jgi:hypothetical protein